VTQQIGLGDSMSTIHQAATGREDDWVVQVRVVDPSRMLRDLTNGDPVARRRGAAQPGLDGGQPLVEVVAQLLRIASSAAALVAKPLLASIHR